MLKVGENCVPQIELLKAVAQLKEEELVVKSSKGPLIVLVVDALLANSTAVEFKKFNDSIVKKMQSCLSANRKREISLTKLWKKFHDLGLSASTRSMWISCIEILHLPEEVSAVSDIILQLLLKRIMQGIVCKLTEAKEAYSPSEESLTPRECNIVRYNYSWLRSL